MGIEGSITRMSCDWGEQREKGKERGEKAKRREEEAVNARVRGQIRGALQARLSQSREEHMHA